MASSSAALFPATDEQYLISLERQLDEWGGGLTLEAFVAREKSLGSKGIGVGLQCWVLATKEDPTSTDFYCSCETFRRPIWVKSHQEPAKFVRVASYSVASVFTPPHHRKKGYATKMMTLLHGMIGQSVRETPKESTPNIDIKWDGGKDGLLSFLYSDVGDFYERCGPTGWKVVSPQQTTWKTDKLQPISFADSPHTHNAVRAVTELDFDDITCADTNMLLEEQLQEPLDPKYENTTTFFIEPDAASLSWANERALFYFRYHEELAPSIWGAEIGERGKSTWGFILWTIDYPMKVIKIQRLRSPSSSANGLATVDLLREVFRFAKKYSCPIIVAWNVSSLILENLPPGERGETKDRDEHLSAMAWYGTPKSQIKWLVNEQYSWC